MNEITYAMDNVDRAVQDMVAELARLRAIEAAARTVLERGEAWFDHPIDPDGHEPAWTGDLVPADAMHALRAAVFRGEGGTP